MTHKTHLVRINCEQCSYEGAIDLKQAQKARIFDCPKCNEPFSVLVTVYQGMLDRSQEQGTKARRKYRCMFCGDSIEKGDRYIFTEKCSFDYIEGTPEPSDTPEISKYWYNNKSHVFCMTVYRKLIKGNLHNKRPTKTFFRNQICKLSKKDLQTVGIKCKSMSCKRLPPKWSVITSLRKLKRRFKQKAIQLLSQL